MRQKVGGECRDVDDKAFRGVALCGGDLPHVDEPVFVVPGEEGAGIARELKGFGGVAFPDLVDAEDRGVGAGVDSLYGVTGIMDRSARDVGFAPQGVGDGAGGAEFFLEGFLSLRDHGTQVKGGLEKETSVKVGHATLGHGIEGGGKVGGFAEFGAFLADEAFCFCLDARKRELQQAAALCGFVDAVQFAFQGGCLMDEPQ